MTLSRLLLLIWLRNKFTVEQNKELKFSVPELAVKLLQMYKEGLLIPCLTAVGKGVQGTSL